MSGGSSRTPFAGRARVEAMGGQEGRRNWLMFLSLCRDHCRRALEGVAVDKFEATQFAGFVVNLAAPFPVRLASADSAGRAALQLARALVVATRAGDREALARFLLPGLNYLDAVIEADTAERASLARRISGERDED